MNSYGFSLRRSKTTSSSVGKSTDSIIQLLPFSSQNQKHTPLYSTSHPEAHCLNKQWKTRHVLKDFLILQIPLVFLFLAAKIALLNDTSVKETSSPREFINTAITFWPYCFAFLLGRATLKFASWNLENASSVGRLEQLLGSRTLTGTLCIHTEMHYWNLMTFCLVLLWCLSPLGGQALVRVLSEVDVPIPSITNVTYANTRAGKYIAHGEGSGMDGYGYFFFRGFGALFGASILAPVSVKNSPVDIWGNIRIPYQSHLFGATDQDGWVSVKANGTTPPTYSSMFGIPTTADFPEGNTSFYLESSYLELDCNQRNTTTFSRFNTSRNSWRVEVKDPEQLLTTKGPYQISRNLSSYQQTTDKSFNNLPADQRDRSGDYGNLWAVGYRGFDPSDLLSKPSSEHFNTTYATAPDAISSIHFDKNFASGTFLFQDRTGYKNLTNIFCTPSQQYVESQVSCIRHRNDTRTCSVVKQRPSKLPHMSNALSILAFPRIMHLIGKYIPNATTLRSEEMDFLKVDFLTNYLVNQDPTYITANPIAHINQSESALQDISLQTFGSSLGQILNSFIHSTMSGATQFLTGEPLTTLKGSDSATLRTLTSLGLKVPSYTPSKSPTEVSDEMAKGLAAFTVTGNSTTPIKKYKASWPWLIILFLASFIMLLAAIASIVYNYITTIPDYLGHVSSLVQESRFATGVEGHAGLDGLERTRLMKDRMVRFGDVGGLSDEVGVLGIGDVEGTRRVRRGKLYTTHAK